MLYICVNILKLCVCAFLSILWVPSEDVKDCIQNSCGSLAAPTRRVMSDYLIRDVVSGDVLF